MEKFLGEAWIGDKSFHVTTEDQQECSRGEGGVCRRGICPLNNAWLLLNKNVSVKATLTTLRVENQCTIEDTYIYKKALPPNHVSFCGVSSSLQDREINVYPGFWGGILWTMSRKWALCCSSEEENRGYQLKEPGGRRAACLPHKQTLVSLCIRPSNVSAVRCVFL